MAYLIDLVNQINFNILHINIIGLRLNQPTNSVIR